MISDSNMINNTLQILLLLTSEASKTQVDCLEVQDNEEKVKTNKETSMQA